MKALTWSVLLNTHFVFHSVCVCLWLTIDLSGPSLASLPKPLVLCFPAYSELRVAHIEIPALDASLPARAPPVLEIGPFHLHTIISKCNQGPLRYLILYVLEPWERARDSFSHGSDVSTIKKGNEAEGGAFLVLKSPNLENSSVAIQVSIFQQTKTKS